MLEEKAVDEREGWQISVSSRVATESSTKMMPVVPLDDCLAKHYDTRASGLQEQVVAAEAPPSLPSPPLYVHSHTHIQILESV